MLLRGELGNVVDVTDVPPAICQQMARLLRRVVDQLEAEGHAPCPDFLEQAALWEQGAGSARP